MSSTRRGLSLQGHRDATYLNLIGGIWEFRRRVPKDLAGVDPRKQIRVSTGTRDWARAVSIAARLNEELEEHWRLLAQAAQSGATPPNIVDDFARAVTTARRLGFSYKPASELAQDASLPELVARVKTLKSQPTPTAPHAVTAMLGGVERPTIRLSDLFAEYEKLAADHLIGKSTDQIRKWKNPRLRAINNLITLIGDKPIAAIGRDDALDFRSWWLDRVRDEGYDQGSANKDFGHIANMMKTIDEAWRLKLDLTFQGISIAGERHNPRVPYEPDFVRQHILTGTRLDPLNPEARGVVLMVATTGMRPSEVVALTTERIVLEAEIPHVQIRPDNRQLKTTHSERDMPLVGKALDVMREFNAGFPRYRDAPDTLSATVNKGLAAAGLRPTTAHTLYSLRHTFKDRLIALEVPERIQDALMGHAVREVKYGAGPTLQHRADWLRRVWCD